MLLALLVCGMSMFIFASGSAFLANFAEKLPDAKTLPPEIKGQTIH